MGSSVAGREPPPGKDWRTLRGSIMMAPDRIRVQAKTVASCNAFAVVIDAPLTTLPLNMRIVSGLFSAQLRRSAKKLVRKPTVTPAGKTATPSIARSERVFYPT